MYEYTHIHIGVPYGPRPPHFIFVIASGLIKTSWCAGRGRRVPAHKSHRDFLKIADLLPTQVQLYIFSFFLSYFLVN